MKTTVIKLKRWLMHLMVFIMVLGMTPSVVPMNQNVTMVQAAQMKISKKKLTLKVGQKKALKVTGTTKAVKWSSSKESVATVNKNGKLTAKKKGTTIITAKVGSEKYSCTVTVTKAVSKTPVATSYVWKSATGSKYHRINNCGNMNPARATRITKIQAENMGLTACRNCW